MNILLWVLTFALILVALFLIMVVLMQKAKSDGGLGAAMGGGMAEATFGADTSNVLSKATINASIAFFVISFLLYLGRIYQHRHASEGGGALPVISGPALPPAPAGAAPFQAAPPPSSAPLQPPNNGAKP